MLHKISRKQIVTAVGFVAVALLVVFGWVMLSSALGLDSGVAQASEPMNPALVIGDELLPEGQILPRPIPMPEIPDADDDDDDDGDYLNPCTFPPDRAGKPTIVLNTGTYGFFSPNVASRSPIYFIQGTTYRLIDVTADGWILIDGPCSDDLPSDWDGWWLLPGTSYTVIGG